MPDKKEIEKRKEIKKKLREKAIIEFEKKLPISSEIFLNLFDFLDEKLSKSDCEDTLKLTTEFLIINKIENIVETKNWLNNNGGFCDCEVLYNIEEKFEDFTIL